MRGLYAGTADQFLKGNRKDAYLEALVKADNILKSVMNKMSLYIEGKAMFAVQYRLATGQQVQRYSEPNKQNSRFQTVAVF